MRSLLAIAGMFLFSQTLHAGSVVGSLHDLSSGSTTPVCAFCHTPHNANTNATIPGAPLWNRAETTQTFTLYGSPTMDTAPAQPSVASRLCLSCHDGVSASTMVNGNLVSTKHQLVNPQGSGVAACIRCHELHGPQNKMKRVGTDLTNDHPISMPYPTPAQDPFFNTPPDASNGWGGLSKNDVKLYAGGIECGSCHNVHNPDYGRFLRKANAGSVLCLTCHKK